jgi:hypothetical protein
MERRRIGRKKEIKGIMNALNAELKSIRHKLVIVGGLTLKVSSIESIIQYTSKSNKMQHYTVYLIVETKKCSE